MCTLRLEGEDCADEQVHTTQVHVRLEDEDSIKEHVLTAQIHVHVHTCRYWDCDDNVTSELRSLHFRRSRIHIFNANSMTMQRASSASFIVVASAISTCIERAAADDGATD